MTDAKKIISPTDFSETAERANRKAVRMAERDGAEVVFVYVLEETGTPALSMMKHKSFPNLADEIRKGAEREIEELTRKLAGDRIRAKGIVRYGSPAAQIAECAEEEGADLIVIGTHGYGALRKFFVGSTAERLMRIAPCSVLLVRGDDDGKRPD